MSRAGIHPSLPADLCPPRLPSPCSALYRNETSLTLYSPRLGSKGGARDLRLTVSCFVDNSPSGALAITGSGDGRVVMWDVPYLATSHHSQVHETRTLLRYRYRHKTMQHNTAEM